MGNKIALINKVKNRNEKKLNFKLNLVLFEMENIYGGKKKWKNYTPVNMD